jgi:hypothetical protein
MNHDKRFALIDSEGIKRYAQILKGTFQIGKDRRRTPTSIENFTRAILIEGEDGRFIRADRTRHGILKYGAREARSYIVDPTIAAKLGIPTRGSR